MNRPKNKRFSNKIACFFVAFVSLSGVSAKKKTVKVAPATDLQSKISLKVKNEIIESKSQFFDRLLDQNE